MCATQGGVGTDRVAELRVLEVRSLIIAYLGHDTSVIETLQARSGLQRLRADVDCYTVLRSRCSASSLRSCAAQHTENRFTIAFSFPTAAAAQQFNA